MEMALLNALSTGLTHFHQLLMALFKIKEILFLVQEIIVVRDRSIGYCLA